MRRGRALLIIFLLALAIGSAAFGFMTERRGNYGLRGEVLCGERSAAEGFRLNHSALLTEPGSYNSAHLVWDVDYVPAAGAGETESRWSMEPVEHDPGIGRDILRLGAPGVNIDISWTGRGGPPDSLPDWILAIIDDLLAMQRREGAAVEAALRLRDYTDVLPLSFESDALDTAEAYLGAFAVETPESYMVRALLENDMTGGRLSIGPDSYSLSYSCDAVLAGGDVYLCLDYYSYSGSSNSGTPEGVSPEHMPGGSWGVYRIPCESGEDGALKPDFSRAENVYPLTEHGSEGMSMAVSPDGGELLLAFAEDDGSLTLKAVSLPGGEVKQSLCLAGPGGGNRVEAFAAGDGWAAVKTADYAACAVTEEGAYRALPAAPLDAVPTPADIRVYETLNGDVRPDMQVENVEFAMSGGRLAMLETGYYFDAAEQIHDFARLSVFSAGELAYCEFFSFDALSPITARTELGVGR